LINLLPTWFGSWILYSYLLALFDESIHPAIDPCCYVFFPVFDDFFYYGVLPERESGLHREIKEAG
jgi:hypothetical protein